jgi:hypothetical protein
MVFSGLYWLFWIILVILGVQYYFGTYGVSRVTLVILEFSGIIFIILGVSCVFWLF